MRYQIIWEQYKYIEGSSFEKIVLVSSKFQSFDTKNWITNWLCLAAPLKVNGGSSVF